MWWAIGRRLLFLLDPEWAHNLSALFLRLLGFCTQGRIPPPARRSQRWRPELAGMPLDSPLGLAAGFDKDAKLVLGLRALGFGFIEVGTVTPEPQKGNPRPRLFRLPEARALINRMGFNSEGADAVADRLTRLRALAKLRFPLGVNLGKNRETPLEAAARDYVVALEKLYAVADYLVVNLSSPNTPGLTSLQEGKLLAGLLRAVREARDRSAARTPGPSRPLLLKLSPDLLPGAMREAVELAVEEGYGIIAANTSRRRDFAALGAVDSLQAAEPGGLSGRPLQETAVELIRDIRSWVGSKPLLISVGGLSGAEDARRRLELGANLLQVYTEFIYAGPGFPRAVQRDLGAD